MVTHVQSVVHSVLGIIGNVISLVLFLSPLPTFWRIVKSKDVEEFQPYPYLASLINCTMWVYYGLPFVTPNSILVITINAAGAAIEIIYLAIFLWFSHSKKQRLAVFGFLGAIVAFMATIVIATLLGVHHQKRRSLIVGVFCDVFNVVMYSSPILIASKVIKTKSVEYMPLALSLANFSNGVIWVAYAIVIFDPFILISNGLGVIAGALQLILYFFYYFKYPQKKDKTTDNLVKPSEVQLSDANAA